MAAAKYTYVTIYDEVVAALNFNADNTDVTASVVATTYLTEAIVNRLAYKRVVGNESNYTAQKVATGIYVAGIQYRYWLLPTFTGELASPTANEYAVNATGSIEVTVGVHSTDAITVSATPVNFCMLMVDVLRYIGNHFARTGNSAFAGASFSPSTVRSECMKQASHWASENYLYF